MCFLPEEIDKDVQAHSHVIVRYRTLRDKAISYLSELV